MKLEQTVKEYIKCQHLLIPANGLYLVALSGGADSVALLLSLKALGYQVEACHCNFHLRGEESDRDEQFCQELCLQLHVPLHLIHFDTREYAALHKISIEMAARNLRYHYFEQLRQDIHAVAICVAHHQDDSVETVLINLIRGTGINGLTGISPKNGNIQRPLLCVNRNDILAYLKALHQDYVTDSSNLVDDVVRNKIRLNVLPLLKDMNPAVFNNITKTASHLKEANKLINEHLTDRIHQEQENGVTRFNKAEIMSLASPEYALFCCLSPFGFSGSTIQEIVNSINTIGKTWYSATHQVVIDRTDILVYAIEEKPMKAFKIPEEGTYLLGKEQRIKVKTQVKDINFVPSKEQDIATLDAAKVRFPLTVRLAQIGDRFHPFGMKGSKLVSDYLTDHKRNIYEKRHQMVVEDGNGEIVWLVGERTSERGRIDDATTCVITLQIKNEK